MDFIFADDSSQKRPSRKGVKPLLAIGGLYVPSDEVAPLELEINDYCKSIGFPSGEQFKWSPGRKESFQKNNLKDKKRTAFFLKLLDLAKKHKCRAVVVISDTDTRFVIKTSKSNEEAVTTMFFERCDWLIRTSGLLIVAKPSGGRKDENKFVAECLDIIKQGTKYSQFKKLPLGVLTAPSRQLRLLQLSDIIVSCAVSRVAGESDYSPIVFDALKPLFDSDGSRIGGIGLKIHPDMRYLNLYYWLLGETHWCKGSAAIPLPNKSRPYSNSAHEGNSTNRDNNKMNRTKN